MSRLNEYREKIKGVNDLTSYLLKNSGLPGPRGNLELALAVAEEGTIEQFNRFLNTEAEENTPQVFLVFCGVVGLGKLAAKGNPDLFPRLRGYASDPRWRIREGVATAMQYVGDTNMNELVKQMEGWSKGNWYEKRAAAAALAEPRLLNKQQIVIKVLEIFDQITSDIEKAGHPKDEAFKVLLKGMGYCWSVAVAALPKPGKQMMQKWLKSHNPDVKWILKENLKKNRLIKMDGAWVKACQEKL